MITGTFTYVADPKTTRMTNTQNVYLQCDTSGGPVVINLCEISALLGFNNIKIFISDESGNAATNNITINAAGIDKIDSGASITLSTNFETVMIQVADENSWIALESEQGGGGGGTVTAVGVIDTADIDLSVVNPTTTPQISGVLTDTPVTPGTYGDGTNSAIIEVDQKGRVVNITTAAITASPVIGTFANWAALKTAITGNALVQGQWYSVPDTYNGISGVLFVFATEQNSIAESASFNQTSLLGEVDSVLLNQDSATANGAIVYREDKNSNKISGAINIGKFMWGNVSVQNNVIDAGCSITTTGFAGSIFNNEFKSCSNINLTSFTGEIQGCYFYASQINAPSFSGSVIGCSANYSAITLNDSTCTIEGMSLQNSTAIVPNSDSILQNIILRNSYVVLTRTGADLINCIFDGNSTDIAPTDSIIEPAIAYQSKNYNFQSSSFDLVLDSSYVSGTTLTLPPTRKYYGTYVLDFTATIDTIVNLPSHIENIQFRVTDTNVVTINGTAVSGITANKIALESASIALTGRVVNSDYLTLQKQGNYNRQVEASVLV